MKKYLHPILAGMLVLQTALADCKPVEQEVDLNSIRRVHATGIDESNEHSMQFGVMFQVLPNIWMTAAHVLGGFKDTPTVYDTDLDEYTIIAEDFDIDVALLEKKEPLMESVPLKTQMKRVDSNTDLLIVTIHPMDTDDSRRVVFPGKGIFISNRDDQSLQDFIDVKVIEGMSGSPMFQCINDTWKVTAVVVAYVKHPPKVGVVSNSDDTIRMIYNQF